MKRRWLSVLGLSSASLVDFGEENTLTILWPYMYRSLNAPISQLGSILSVSKFIVTITLPLWGYAADRFSRKALLVWFTGIWGLWTLVISLVNTSTQLFIVRGLAALGLSVLTPTSFSLVGDLFGSQERGRVVGVMRAFGTIGTIVTFGVLPTLAKQNPEGWRIGFVTFGLASLITGLLIMFIKEPPRGASEPELKDVITDKAAGRYTFKWADLRALAKIRSWWLLALKDVLGTMSIGVFFGWGFTWLAGLGLGELGSIVILVILVGAIVGYITAGWLGDRLERRFPEQGRNALILAGLVLALPVIIVLLTTTGKDLTRLLAAGLIFSLTLGIYGDSVSWPVAQAVLPPELRGSGRAAISMASGLASALILSLSSLVVDRVGIASMQLLIVPAPLFLSIVAWLPMFRAYPRDRAGLHETLTRRRVELLDEQKKW